MWQKIVNITAPDRAVLERFKATFEILSYKNDSNEYNAFTTVNIARASISARQWTLYVTRNRPSPEEFAAGAEHIAQSVFQCVDKKKLAMKIYEVLLSDNTFLASADEIRDLTGINYNDRYIEDPEFWLQEDVQGEKLLYKDKSQYGSLVIGILNGSLHILVPRGRDFYSIPNVTEASIPLVRNYLVTNNLSTNQDMINSILDKTVILIQENAAQRTSSTSTPVLSQSLIVQQERAWEEEFKRYSNLLCGIETERSAKILAELAKKMLERNKNNDTYKAWINWHHGRIANLDDLKFFAKNEHFYQKFMHSDSEKFRYVIFRGLRDYLSTIGIDMRFSTHNDNFVPEMRRELKLKSGDFPNNVNYVLLILAKYYPINEIDSATQQPIEKGMRVFVTEGHQHDIRSLIAWHVARDLKEGENHKQLLNPNTFNPIPEINANYIFEMARTHPDTSGFKFQKRKNILKQMIRDVEISDLLHLNMFATPDNLQRRLFRLPSDDRIRLVISFQSQEHGTEFKKGLLKLLNKTMSIEAFSALDSERQHILALGKQFEYMLASGVEVDNILKLSAKHLKLLDSMWLNMDASADDNLRKFNTRIDGLLEIQEDINDEQALNHQKCNIK